VRRLTFTKNSITEHARNPEIRDHLGIPIFGKGVENSAQYCKVLQGLYSFA
jgi:hypothetical protein